MESRAPVLALCLAVAAASAGCGGSGPPAPRPCPQVVTDVQWTMTDPAPGATNVPTTIGAIVVPAHGFAAAGVRVYVTPSGGAPIEGGQFEAGGGNTETASIPTLSSHTTYAVTGGAPPTTCPGSSVTFGSFTTG